MNLRNRIDQSDTAERLLPYFGVLLTAVVTVVVALLFGAIVLIP